MSLFFLRSPFFIHKEETQCCSAPYWRFSRIGKSSFRASVPIAGPFAQALGTLTAFGRRTLSRAIWAQGHEQEDWSADYKLHARANWRAADLFQPILARALPGVAVVMWSSRSMTRACTRRGGAFKALSTNMIRCLPSSFTT